VLEEWIVVDALPSGPVVPDEPLNVTSPVVPQLTVARGTGAPFESVTVAVAVDVEMPPSFRIDDGESVTATALGTPGAAHALLIGMRRATRRPTRANPQTRRERTRELPLAAPTVPPDAPWCPRPEDAFIP
jgi:hypothetical protein